VLIAFSILVSAGHAWRPLFPGKERLVAGGFGLIHGMAFAATLTNLHLSAGPMALSILGFNIGIELMQLFVIAVTIPWLILLSPSPWYRWVRIGGALLAGIAAIAWMLERVTGSSNLISLPLSNLADKGIWVIGMIAIIAILNKVIARGNAGQPVA
jgi:hypothetical protein